MDSVQESDLAPSFRFEHQSEKPSEIKPPLFEHGACIDFSSHGVQLESIVVRVTSEANFEHLLFLKNHTHTRAFGKLIWRTYAALAPGGP